MTLGPPAQREQQRFPIRVILLRLSTILYITFMIVLPWLARMQEVEPDRLFLKRVIPTMNTARVIARTVFRCLRTSPEPSTTMTPATALHFGHAAIRRRSAGLFRARRS